MARRPAGSGPPRAIKELDPRLLGSPGFLERFRAEARTLATLEDPHVVRVYDYVEEFDHEATESGRAYLVQEWVDGGPLSGVLLRHGRLTPAQSLGVLRGALTGLAHAHARGLVHGDISPGNIMLDTADMSKLVDFGLAVPTGSGGVAGTPTGTPAFSSPEAATGRPMTARSDVYSLPRSSSCCCRAGCRSPAIRPRCWPRTCRPPYPGCPTADPSWPTC